MHKQLMLLGLLLRGPRHGYELNRAIHAHGVIYSDLKKANVYYLLNRMAEQGYVTVLAEASTHGPRGEKLIYSITEAGKVRFAELIRAVIRRYEPVHTGIEVATVLLDQLSAAEAIELLEERRKMAVAHRDALAREFNTPEKRPLTVAFAADHLFASVDAELAWIGRTLDRLRPIDQADGAVPKMSRDHD